MGYLNRKKTRPPYDKAHLNWMGGPSFDIQDPLLRLRLAASSCFFGEPMYYQRDLADSRPVRHRPPSRLSGHDLAYLRETLHAIDPQEWRSLTPAQLMEMAIDEALAANPEAALAEAARLRQDEHIRTTPQVILVRAAHHERVRGTGLVRRFAPQIVARADEPAVGLAYHLARFGKPVPNALKKAWREALERSDDEYQLAKYRLEGHEVKTLDVANLVHPKSAVVDKLMRGELRVTGQTWEAIISARGSTKESWSEALPVMGHMALLRNLRNLINAGVEPKRFIGKLVEGAANGKQLPFRYYSAYRTIEKLAPPIVLDAVEDSLMQSLGSLPRFQGRVIALVDNSGSARGTATSSMGTMPIATIGNLTGILTGMQSDEGYVGVFGDRLDILSVRKKSSVFDQLSEVEKMGAQIGGGTENGIWLFWDEAIRERQHWDMVFVYSDMQAGHGWLYGTDVSQYRDFVWLERGGYIDVPRLIKVYRQTVNPDVLVFLVQIAGYQDTIVPEFYDKTYLLGGWGDGLLRFAAAMVDLNQRQ